MSTAFALAQLVGVFFVGVCILVLILDIVRTIFYQFKGDGYEWDSIKLLKNKRRWWEWVIVLAVFAVGVYALLPSSIVGKEDFRASKQKPEYTAYYECEYDIEHFGSGEGYISVSKKDGDYIAERIYTEEGYVVLNLWSDIENDRITQSLGVSCYAEIEIGDGPLERESLNLNNQKITLYVDGQVCQYCEALIPEGFAYISNEQQVCPDCIYSAFDYMADPYIWKCEICCSFYDGDETDMFGYCSDCEEEFGRECAYCGRYTAAWGTYGDDFALCESCLIIAFQDEEIRKTVLERMKNGGM